MKDTIEIEMLAAYQNGTWSTWTVEIPVDTPDDKINEVAEEKAYAWAVFHDYDDIAYMGVCNIDQDQFQERELAEDDQEQAVKDYFGVE